MLVLSQERFCRVIVNNLYTNTYICCVKEVYVLGITAFVGLLVMFSSVQLPTGQFVTGIHMGAPSKNVKLSKKLINGKEVMQAIIVPDKPLAKLQCRQPMCWYEDRYRDASKVWHITGKRDVKGVNINRCHSDNSLVEVRVRNEKECFTQKIYCKPDGLWTTWQEPKKC